ncbi:MAG: putative iron-sulfur protein [Actinomycetia bacterium]|nr:putative iron-sulfur protein [Actinomycetes bacterium]
MLVSDTAAFRRFWYPLGFVDRLAGRPHHRRLLGSDLVVWIDPDGEASVAADRCPHRDARLSAGWQCDDGAIVCPYHGWEYGSDGKVRAIPALEPGSTLPPKAQLDLVTSTVRYGIVWASLDPDPIGGIPELPEYDDDGWWNLHEFDDEWACSAPHLLDNNMDGAHLSFVHSGTFGSDDTRVPSPRLVERTAEGIRMATVLPIKAKPGDVGESERNLTIDVVGPFLGVFRIEYPDGLVHIMVKGCVPVDDSTSRLVQLVMRNDAGDPLAVEEIVRFDTKVQEEDRHILDALPPAYATDLTANVHLKCDRGSVELRRMYADMAAGDLPPYA